MFNLSQFCVLFLVLTSSNQWIHAAPPFPKVQTISAKESNGNRPDHLNALPLERDGELNMEFRKELLLGAVDGTEEKNDKEIVHDQIKEIADEDSDGKLSKDELKSQLLSNVRRHLEKARNNSEAIFQQVDTNGDGLVSWNEYKAHFMVAKKIVDADHAKKHAEDHSENMDANSRFMIDEEKAAFQKADSDENGLDDIEFLGLQHPEHSRVMLNDMTDDLFKNFDRDQNGEVSLDEFTYVPPGVVDDNRMDQEYVDARKHEFENAIDLNHDGKVTKEELRNYLDPLNENHVQEEVDEIMDFADDNKDSFLTLKELLRHVDLLSSSSFLHARTRLHDDL
ncbi:45 kDa calcium-binding protein [Aphelenchoides besseyi]|nr:45 kDa calcium-binding protein [Aphelenchoides besseyi]